MDTTNFETRWDTIVPQAISQFEINVRRIHKEDPKHYGKNPKEWFKLKSANEKHMFLMNDDYWVGHLANFFLKMLIDEIYREPKSKLNSK